MVGLRGVLTDTEARVIFRQLFDSTSGTYSYLLASRHGGEALIIDPVLERVDRWLQLVRELDLRLVKAVDTHLHADHVTGLGELRDRTRCITVMGEHSRADVVSMRVAEGDRIDIEGLRLDVLYTPGHTDDSYSFLLADRVFTGDTLLIRGTGRTDFQNDNPRAIRFHLQQADEAARRNAGLPRARLQGRNRLHHRRGQILQSADQGGMRVSNLPVTSRAASRPGRTPTDRSRAEGMGVKFELNRDFPRPLGVDRCGKIGPNPHSNRLKDFSSDSES